jgi:hypothetical protein
MTIGHGFRAEVRGIAAAAIVCFTLSAVLVFDAPSEAQDVDPQRIKGMRRGGELTFEPTGPGVLFGALDPAVKKWYVPQELFHEYRWKQWEYTNYARDLYDRYVDTSREGDYFYDIYGSFVTRGWLVYDWTQTQPSQGGSNLFKTERFASFFSNLTIASDQKGQNYLAVTIGDQIRSTLTPMTFSKPAFDGIQVDFQSDKYELTTILSRISSPGSASTRSPTVQERTSLTTLTGGRATAQLGDFVKVGANYVSAHNSFQLLDAFEGSPRSGSITSSQNSDNVTQVFVRLTDDSPEDNEGGATLFAWDMIIEADVEVFAEEVEGEEAAEATIERQVVRASEVGLIPAPQGGFQRRGFWEASGSEQIDLVYNFSDASYTGPDPSEIRKVTFELVVANDYRIEVSSDRQTNRARNNVFLLAGRSNDNVKDGSNLKLLRIPYGLPTATEIYGVTLEANNLMGFDFYGEFDRSVSYRKYPNRQQTEHLKASDQGDGWMMNLSKIAYPFFFFSEAYSMDHNYNTSAILARGETNIDYEDLTGFYYELVDDNDDQDRFPDWQRIFESIDLEVFPGLDENLDFISDFNQNDSFDRPNLVPDYEEPFLRYSTDRPEYLFGMDMNNNIWVDRFENDDEPDFPYRRDLRGYNAYVGANITPGIRITAGRTDEDLIAGDRTNTTNYFLFTLDKDIPGLGTLKIYESLKLAQDDMPNDLRQWSELERRNTPTIDPLAAQDTWINSTYLSFDYKRVRDLNVISKVKYDLWHQKEKQPDLRDDFIFLGLVNKVDYTFKIGTVDIQPRIKNELRIESPALKASPKRREDTILLFLLTRWPVLNKSSIQTGVEYTIFQQFRDSEKAVKEGLLDDFTEIVGAAQFSNTTAYLGYSLTTQMGVRLTRRSIDGDTETGRVAFATVYAGLQ